MVATDGRLGMDVASDVRRERCYVASCKCMLFEIWYKCTNDKGSTSHVPGKGVISKSVRGHLLVFKNSHVGYLNLPNIITHVVMSGHSLCQSRLGSHLDKCDISTKCLSYTSEALATQLRSLSIWQSQHESVLNGSERGNFSMHIQSHPNCS